MHGMIARWLWPLRLFSFFSIVGVSGLAIPVTQTGATERALPPAIQHARTDQTTDINRSSSDRQHLRQMLQQLGALPIDKNKQFYRQALQDQGYTVLKVHADSPQELDVVVQKNRKRIAFLVAFDAGTGHSTDIEALRVRRRATRGAAKPREDVAQKTPQQGKQDDAAPPQRKPKDAAKQEQHQEQAQPNEPTLLQLVEELRAFPIGKEKDFYPHTLQERGYTIANTQETQNQTEFTLEKGAQTLRFIVQFDELTGTSVTVHASGARLAGEPAEQIRKNQGRSYAKTDYEHLLETLGCAGQHGVCRRLAGRL